LADSFFTELKRRNVFKVGVAYLVLAWVVIQVTSEAVPALRLPEWVNSFVFFLGAIGFPFALFFAWAFEITPDGIKKESDIPPEESINAHTGRKLDFAIIGLLAVGMSYFIYESRFSTDTEQDVVEPAIETKEQTEEAIQEPEGASIAVLAFVNMSSDPEQEYFSDGISEEILNVLAKIDGLSVAARTSSFYFKGQNLPVGDIAKTLGVKHILEGSVRKAGSKVRITAQLIRAEDGFHLWSDTYDHELDNIFAIQDEISAAIVQELRGRLMSETPVIQHTGTTNQEAFDEYLKGLYLWNQRTVEYLYRAKGHFERATELDANYADAWLGLGETLVILPLWEFDNDKAPVHHNQARQAVEKALAINPKSGRGYAILGDIHLQLTEWQEGIEDFQRAIKYEPKLATSWQWYGGVLSSIGKIEESIEALDNALRLDPHSRVVASNHAETLLIAGQNDAALERTNKLLVIAPNFSYGMIIQGYIHLVMHDFDAARTSFSLYADTLGIPKKPLLEVIAGIETFIIEGTTVPINDVIYDPVSHDQYYTSMALVLGGHYNKALDTIERLSKSNIPLAGVFFMHSQLYKQSMGDMPRYQELLERLSTLKTEK
jgi:TolB-like protein